MNLADEFRKKAVPMWQDRRDFGYGWKTDVFKFISDNYQPWLGKGLTQRVIKEYDLSLWHAIQRNRNEKPSDLDIPTDKDIKDRSITDPEEKIRLLHIREYWKREKRRARERKLSK